ncbi:hypothetical protein [Paracoccus beibuensis]|uniref:hypothetical protein n=1 Tax=Paracoccus beibuensis TaxID=547602 RepID=UPI002240C85D|nr:hypothetical protein [Paracoccus beibuensis]
MVGKPVDEERRLNKALCEMQADVAMTPLSDEVRALAARLAEALQQAEAPGFAPPKASDGLKDEEGHA